jgi:hypothetical protein
MNRPFASLSIAERPLGLLGSNCVPDLPSLGVDLKRMFRYRHMNERK